MIDLSKYTSNQIAGTIVAGVALTILIIFYGIWTVPVFTLIAIGIFIALCAVSMLFLGMFVVIKEQIEYNRKYRNYRK